MLATVLKLSRHGRLSCCDLALCYTGRFDRRKKIGGGPERKPRTMTAHTSLSLDAERSSGGEHARLYGLQ